MDTSATIATAGLPVETLVPDQPDVVCLPEAPGRSELETLVDSLAGPLGASAPTIVIYQRRSPEPACQRLETVQLALDRRLVFYATDLPPLAAAVLAAICARLARELPSAGILLGAMPVVARELVWVTWLSSVSGLSEPSPSLRQHAVSYLPGRTFAVSSWPEPTIHVLTRMRRRIPLPELLHEFNLAVAPRDGDEAWISSVAEELGSPPRREFDATPAGPGWWGTDHLVEAVAYPVDMPALAKHASAGLTPRPCGWCEALVVGSPCPFCGHGVPRTVPEATATPEAAQPHDDQEVAA